MAANNENGWLNAFYRESGIRRCLIVHGNVNDVCYNAETQEYRPVLDVVSATLKKRGFDEVASWDRFSGVQNVSADVREEIEREAAMGCQTGQQSGGEDYDFGDDEPAAAQTGDAQPNPEDFLAVVYHHMLNPKTKRYAFVIDRPDYLFGNANALSEAERQWLMIMAKSLRDAPLPMDAENIDKPANLLVLVACKLGRIPPPFYQDNPQIKEIIIPVPGRVERETFVKRNLQLWNLRNVLKPGQVDFDDFIDGLEGFTLRDIQQVIKLSRQVKDEPLTPDKLINLYKYGDKSSPWEDLSRDKLAGLEDTIQDRVKGQDEAIAKACAIIRRAYTGLSGLQHSRKQKMPKGVLFFVGPTGVGKTELAKATAVFLFGDEAALLRYDMSEYNHEHSDQRLIGAPPGYVGYEEGGQLTNAVKKKPFSVLLFDEIEKAHPRILDKFLQILEDGRLTDGKGETVYFSETIIIFTSNIGAAEIPIDKDHEAVKHNFLKKVRRYFIEELQRPEILNRIGENIVPFNFITCDDFLVSIAKGKLYPLKERLQDKYRIQDLVFENETEALSAVVKRVDRTNGGRGVLNELVTCLIDPLSEFLFYEEDDPSCYAGRKILVRQAGDTANFFFELE